MGTAISIPLSEAKSGLSALVHSVQTEGAEYVITLRNKPVAKVVPLQPHAPAQSTTRGALKAFASDTLRAQEAGAWQQAAVAKHENAS